MKVLLGAISIFSIFFLISCATSKNALPRFDAMLRDETGQNGRACVRSSDIDGYGVLKHKIVSIDGGRKYYLATLLPGCISFETSMSALFAGDFGEICGGSGDSVVTREERCGIGQMFEFASRKEAFAVYDQLVEKRAEMAKEKADQTP